MFAQDQWSVQRLTLNLGVRFDYLNGMVREQHMPAGTFVPARDFAAVKNVPNWKDLNPRIARPTTCSAPDERLSKGSSGVT